MKVQVGIGSRDELDYYLREGADELYCGIYSVPNHVKGARNFGSVADVLSAKDAAHARGVNFFFAANEVSKERLAGTVAVIAELVGGGVDGVIVKDLALLDALRKKKVKTEYILSTLANCMNPSALAFYREYGVRRVALPQQLKPAEAADMLRGFPGMEAEAFVNHREYCINYNGLCFLDCVGGSTTFCDRRFKSGKKDFFMSGPGAAEHLGNLYDHHRLGVGVLKVGRSPEKENSRLIFLEALRLVRLLDGGFGKKEFLARALKVKESFDGIYEYMKERM